MKPSSKTDAQRRADQIETFREELSLLERERIVSLTEAQRRAIDDHHRGVLEQLSSAFDIDRSKQAKQLSLGMQIASFLGALALAASVFFLFYQFWGKLSTVGQLVILIGAPLVTLIATFIVSQKDETGYFVKLAAMVSFACFVLNIVMIGQLFNITPSDNALIAWGVLAFLLAYALDVRLLLAAGILCVIGFLSARMSTWCGLYWFYFGERPENFLPAGVLLFAFPWLVNHKHLADFPVVCRVFGLLTVFIPILILGNWGMGSYLDADPNLIEGWYQVLGFGLSAGVIWLGVRRRWADVVNTGNVFFIIFLYIKFYDWWWESMPKYLFFLIVGLSALLFLLVFKRLRAAMNRPTSEAVA